VKDKLFSGFIWGIGFCFAAAITLKAIGYIESLFSEDRFEISHKINSFEILNKSHRIIKNEKGSSYLVITGEAKSPEFEKINSISISAELRDIDGGFVDSCSYDTALIKKMITIPFKIRCNDISALEQFSTYEFNVQGMEW
jgi:hypothetical protein